MSQLQMGKPNLPSIQFLLQEAPGPNIIPHNTSMDDSVTIPTTTKRQYGHRQSRSVSSLPIDLQSLSLQAPEDMIVSPTQPSIIQPVQHAPPPPPPPQVVHEPYNGIPFPSNEKAPSWMVPNDRPPMNDSLSGPIRRKPSFAGHGRSVSEFTLPPLSSSSSSNTTPPPVSNGRAIKQSHRRAVSANTIDFMLSSPSPNNTMNNSTSSQYYDRTQSYSPQEQPVHQPPFTNNNTQRFFDQIENNTTTAVGGGLGPQTVITADTTGRYVCPYCHKKFSRPSSLRIHTYSHTGEKPFVCTEPGCGRHFSVQSNMRRHLRVHRLGRGSSNGSLNNAGGPPLETTNEEEA